MRRTVIAGLAAGLGGLGTLGGLALPRTARAQAWPSRPARFIVGLGPGSGADTGTRFVAERFTKVTGQPATVENRPGGDGIIAVQTLLQAPPDGHAIMYITPSPMVLTPMLRPETPYDPLRDVRPVAFQSRSYSVIVTGANYRFKTLPELIAEARARPNTTEMAKINSRVANPL
jgi:tripartite-type tricarboxylate transporter receptor subunit TctC